LSKPVQSNAAGGVEGGCTFLQEGQGFDKLSPNGFVIDHHDRKTFSTMPLPHARYIIVHHENVWKINLDNRYFGPFDTQEAAAASAKETARQAAEKGYPASVLLLKGTEFETLWTNVD